jgi:predicted transposase/invertase (TIGR01784 family)
VDVRRWSPESKAELEAFLPLAFHFENAESILDLSERIDTCMQAVQKLDASESMVLADFLNQIALQRLSRESGDNNAQRVLPSIAVGASGGEMVSQLSRRLHKEYEEWKRKELQMLERGRQEGRQEGRLEGRQEGQRLLIVQMCHNGMTISQIAKLISMEEAEVEALLNE